MKICMYYMVLAGTLLYSSILDGHNDPNATVFQSKIPIIPLEVILNGGPPRDGISFY